MDAAQALADLTEISSQIEAAVLGAADGAVQASTFADPDRGARVASAALELLQAAEREGRAGELVQLQAATHEASVFVVKDADRFAAAVTGPDPTVGLVFYDLKTTLRQTAAAAEEPPKPAPKSSPKRKAAAKDDGEAA
jgi:predicted regulator of Ras-like GTPase activity (Roadblock/LC7/MglB family)